MNNATSSPPRSTGRPGRPKDPEKRALILQQAACRFLELGYDATSIDAIASAAGVSKQTVYSHFQNKDELFRACIYNKIEEYGLDFSALPSGLSQRQTLLYLGDQILRLLGDPNVLAMFRVMISEASVRPKVVANFYDSGPRATNRSIARLLQTRMGLAADTAADATHTLFSLLKSNFFIEMLLELRAPLSATEREAQVTRAVDQFLVLYPGAGDG